MTPTQELKRMIDRLDQEFVQENGYSQANTEPYTFAMRVAKVAYAMGMGKMNTKTDKENPYNIDYKRQTEIKFHENRN